MHGKEKDLLIPNANIMLYWYYKCPDFNHPFYRPLRDRTIVCAFGVLFAVITAYLLNISILKTASLALFLAIIFVSWWAHCMMWSMGVWKKAELQFKQNILIDKSKRQVFLIHEGTGFCIPVFDNRGYKLLKKKNENTVHFHGKADFEIIKTIDQKTLTTEQQNKIIRS